MTFKRSSCIHPHSLVPFLLFTGLLFTIFFTGCTGSRGSNEEDLSRVTAVLNGAIRLADMGNIPSAIRFADSMLAEKPLTVREKFKLLGFKSQSYLHLRDTQQAMIYTDSMVSLIESSGSNRYKNEYALANYSKGDFLMMTHNYSDAYSHYYKARLISKKSADSCTLGEYSYRIAMLQYQQSRYLEAATDFKQAFIETSTCSFDFVRYFRMQEVLDNIALCYYNAASYDSARVYANKALVFISGYDGKFPAKAGFNEMAKGVVYGTMGMICKQTGDLQQARDLLQKSIAINTKPRFENNNAQDAQLELADVFYLMHNADSMQIVLQNVRQSMDSLKNSAGEVTWNRLMWKYYQSRHNESKGYDYLVKFTAFNDSTQQADKQLLVNDVSQQINIIENQYEIAALQKENELKDLYLFIFIITLVLAIVIFLFFFYKHRSNSKHIGMLTSLNNKIEEQKVTLEKTLSKLEEKSKDKDRILRVVAHDLRTPTASASMLAELALIETDETSRNELLKLIKTSANNSLSLINEILEVAGMENNKELPKEMTDVNELLKQTVALLRFKAAEKQQQISLYLLRENKHISINKEKIGRVITNLITNAIKFSEKGMEIQVKVTAPNDSVLIAVQDSGIGIPDDLKSKVFDVFTDAKRMGTSGEKPFGLGLSICRQIVEAHHGKIWFESEPGKGTAFYIELKDENISS